jgi:hypothetical protein
VDNRTLVERAGEGDHDAFAALASAASARFLSQDRWVVGKRFYDADGNLLQRHFRETMVGTLDNPESGRSINFIQHDTVLHDLGTPGDVNTGTTRISGLAFRAYADDGTTIQVGAGTLVLDAVGDIVHDGGPHPLDDYFYYGEPDALAPVCAALS